MKWWEIGIFVVLLMLIVPFMKYVVLPQQEKQIKRAEAKKERREAAGRPW